MAAASSVRVKLLIVGTTLAGALRVNEVFFVPTVVLPLLVVTLIEPVPDVPFGI